MKTSQMVYDYPDPPKDYFPDDDKPDFLVCNRCGYKQYDDDAIDAFLDEYPNENYVCGACIDNEE